MFKKDYYLSYRKRLPVVKKWLPADLEHSKILDLIEMSLVEDLIPYYMEQGVAGDITSIATIEPEKRLIGQITAKTSGVVAGLSVAKAIFYLVDPRVDFQTGIADGQNIAIGDKLAKVSGSGPELLAAERVALNFLGRMSGVATLTKAYVDRIAGTGAAILDTRKTIPGWRYLDKYAVRMGGGQNHRMGLFDMALIKDNHIDGAGSITLAIQRVRQMHGSRYPIEVEVKNLTELEEAILLTPERIMLDNMPTKIMCEAVAISAGRVPLEASGNVSLESVREIAETGVDYISVGALTHSAPVFDFSMRMVS